MRLTADEYQRTMDGLVRQTITAIAYFPLMDGEDGLTVDEWDAGAWHEPTMGVELTTATGEVYSAVGSQLRRFTGGVPGQLRALAPADAEQRRYAHDQLRSNVYHQGT